MKENPLISEVMSKRAKQLADIEKQKHIEETRKKLPEFTERIRSIMSPHFSKDTPREPMIGVETHYTLECYVHVDEESESVQINLVTNKNPNRTSNLFGGPTYTMNVVELEEQLQVKNGQGVVVSKEMVSDMPNDIENVILGQQYNNWPAWQEDLDQDKLATYTEVLKMIERPDTFFAPSSRIVRSEY